MYHQWEPDAPPRAAQNGYAWAPRATDQPSPMVTEIYHNAYKDTRNKFCNNLKVWIEVEHHEFDLEAMGCWIFFPSICRRPTELGLEIGGAGLLEKRATKSNGWLRSIWPKNAGSSRRKTRCPSRLWGLILVATGDGSLWNLSSFEEGEEANKKGLVSKAMMAGPVRKWSATVTNTSKYG